MNFEHSILSKSLFMKKIVTLVFLLILLISCEKNESGNLKYLSSSPGGCFLDKALPVNNSISNNPDTASYSFTNDSLNLFIGFNATCCGKYVNSSLIAGDSIIVKIIPSQIGLCNCLCYYTLNFKFSGNANSYKYRIKIADHLNITGVIKH